MEIITSMANARVKAIKLLINDKKSRDASMQYVAEGYNLVKDLPSSEVESYIFTPVGYKEHFDGLHQDKGFILVSDSVMKSLSDTVTPSGIIAVCNKNKKTLDLSRMAVIADNIRDPGNLGTIIRTMVACNVQNLILYKECADVYSPKVVRASMGGISKLNIAYATCIEEIEYSKTIILDMGGENIFNKNMEEFRGATALVVGNEGHGISPEIRESAWKKLALPMSGEMESLNAAVSLSVVLYQIVYGGK